MLRDSRSVVTDRLADQLVRGISPLSHVKGSAHEIRVGERQDTEAAVFLCIVLRVDSGELPAGAYDATLYHAYFADALGSQTLVLALRWLKIVEF